MVSLRPAERHPTVLSDERDGVPGARPGEGWVPGEGPRSPGEASASPLRLHAFQRPPPLTVTE